MSNPSERPGGALDGYGPEDLARVERLAAEERESGAAEPAWADQPDPFGMNWEWAEEPGDTPTAPVPHAAEPGSAPRRPYAVYAGAAALAASVLIAAGFILGGQLGRGRDVELASAVTARDVGVRGPGTVEELNVENRSRRKAFVTVAGVGGRRPAVHYDEAGRFIEVEPGATRVVKNLPAAFDGSAAYLVVLTPTPAGEALSRAVAGGLPATPADARAAIHTTLEGLGYRGATATVVDVTKKN